MKTAFVTGSSRGIGRAIADALTGQGYITVYSGTYRERPDGLPPEAPYLPCDVSKAEDRERAFRYLRDTYHRLDLFVSNAGVAPLVRKDIMETDEESFDRVLGINLKGAFFMCQVAARLMLESRKAGDEEGTPRIVIVSSMSAYTSSVSRGEYCISKAGLSMTARLFADRLAGEGIPVFEVRPGIIDTDMTRGVHEKYEGMIRDGLLPVSRFGKPEDVAKAVLACASGWLDYSAGQTLDVDGGFSLRRL